MTALDKIADAIRAIIDKTDAEHPCDLFALGIIERQVREQAHMLAEGLGE